MASGVGFTLIPLSEDRAAPETKTPALAVVDLASLGTDRVNWDRIRARIGERTVRRIRLESRLGRPMMRVDFADGRDDLSRHGRREGRDPMLLTLAGDPLPLISREEALEQARLHMRNGEDVKNVELLHGRKKGWYYDYNGEFPVWRVDFDHWRKTRIYVSAYTGDIVGRRNINKTLFDICWTLHVFGYLDRNIYGNMPLMIGGLFGVCLVSSGVYLLWVHFSSRRWARRHRPA